jgi:hypothetical protein
MSTDLPDYILTSRTIHELKSANNSESNAITLGLIQTINMIASLMTVLAYDFPCL